MVSYEGAIFGFTGAEAPDATKVRVGGLPLGGSGGRT